MRYHSCHFQIPHVRRIWVQLQVGGGVRYTLVEPSVAPYIALGRLIAAEASLILFLIARAGLRRVLLDHVLLYYDMGRVMGGLDACSPGSCIHTFIVQIAHNCVSSLLVLLVTQCLTAGHSDLDLRVLSLDLC